jgi:hypothetical protein
MEHVGCKARKTAEEGQMSGHPLPGQPLAGAGEGCSGSAGGKCAPWWPCGEVQPGTTRKGTEDRYRNLKIQKCKETASHTILH